MRREREIVAYIMMTAWFQLMLHYLQLVNPKGSALLWLLPVATIVVLFALTVSE